ncbi:NAC domain-containing protein 2-like [Dorcoceras hygrometricum]|uniref:NAC domain-containing protein 2-like n=1 Tax=Dorcoceras hygrometricum TaxID=472368 RepID=A0A2Z7D3R2_9LAMI|nr:NAC domain-containing protein 2-like [Dorcoceras hygrometricum]
MYPTLQRIASGPDEGEYTRVHLRPGFRFEPEDHMLINDYLKKFINFQLTRYSNIPTINVYMFTPRNLSEAYPCQGEDVWYFFTPRDRKRLYRVCANGYWKCYGTKQQIYHDNVRIGYKNSLIFYEGEPPNGRETIWVMKEYIADPPSRLRDDETGEIMDDYVLCRIHMRPRCRLPPRNAYKQLLSSFAKLSTTGRTYKSAGHKRRKTEQQRQYNTLAPHSEIKSADFWKLKEW